MNDANEMNAVLQWEIEEEYLFKAVRDWKSPHTLEFRLKNKKGSAALRLCGKERERLVSRGQEAVCDFNVCVFCLPDPLGDEVALRGLAL